MESILVITKSGIMYSGMTIEDRHENDWLGLRPSKKSEVCIFFPKKHIEKIYHTNGIIESPIVTDAKNSEISSFSNIALIRLRGGVSYRGEILENAPDGISSSSGFWLMPNLNGELIFNIPENEVERIFTS